jgi:hypothetical protein
VLQLLPHVYAKLLILKELLLIRVMYREAWRQAIDFVDPFQPSVYRSLLSILFVSIQRIVECVSDVVDLRTRDFGTTGLLSKQQLVRIAARAQDPGILTC